MKILLQKLLPENKKDAYAYMLLLVICLPLIYLSFGQRLSYMLLNYFCLLIFSVVFIIKFIFAIRSKTLKNYFKSSAFLLLSLMFGWIFVSGFFAYDKMGSIFGFIDGKLVESSIFQYLFFFFVAICAINLKKENIRYIISSLITFACFMILIQFAVGDYSFGFINRNHTGYYLCMTLMLAVGRFFASKNVLESLLLLFAIILHIASLSLNGSLGPIVGIIAFLVVGLIYVLIHNRKLVTKFLSVFACFLLVVTFCDYFPTMKKYREEEITTCEKVIDLGIYALNKIGIIDERQMENIDLAEGTDGYGRLGMWQRAIDNMFESPLFGVGIAWHSKNPDMPNMKPHNEFLQYGAMSGVPALVFYVALILLLFAKFRKTHKTQSDTSFMLISALFVYLVQSIFGNVMAFVAPIFYMLVGLLIKNLDADKFEQTKIS